MANKLIGIEVAYAGIDRQLVIPLEVAEDASLEDAVRLSGILRHFPEIDLKKNAVGVFGKVCKLSQTLAPGDRVEIYRALQQDPMTARRNRAAAK